jgi:hypothetical protein
VWRPAYWQKFTGVLEVLSLPTLNVRQESFFQAYVTTRNAKKKQECENNRGVSKPLKKTTSWKPRIFSSKVSTSKLVEETHMVPEHSVHST